ncbi:MAG: prephenate dehydrogenase/arogenate dehydrogenase family protein [Patescibacteria group bacterium]
MSKKKPLIGIIGGTSQFGQWFKFFFENNGCNCLVAGRKTRLTAEKLAKQADIVIISVPIRETTKVIREIRDLLKPEALLCDFTSLKVDSLKEMLKRKHGGILGIHPLFGPLVPSMTGQHIVFCKGRDNNWVNFLENLFESKGGKVIKINSKKHDKQMAMVQALTHFTNIAFAKVIQRQKIQPFNAFSTPNFKLQSMLAGRILGLSPSLCADIEIENKIFHGLLKQYINDIKKLSRIVLSGKKIQFESEFRSIAKSMSDFIPIAQIKTSEIMHLLDKQPVEIKKTIHIINKLGAKTINVACLGPEGTFSHTASKNIFSKEKNFLMTSTINQVFKAIQGDFVKFGVVPIENSTAGVVQETLDSILNYPLRVIGSYKMEIHHNLLGRTKSLNNIKIIRSHIQPLGQCREWISQNLPKATIEPQDSSTKAILSTNDPRVAFIGSKEAAKEYGLKILTENIEDNKNNITEFYILAKNTDSRLGKSLGSSRTLMIVAVYDRPGVLNDILKIFANHKLNLTKLHSRASVVEGWDYYFFLEIDCLPNTRDFKMAFQEVKKYCSLIRIFGVS